MGDDCPGWCTRKVENPNRLQNSNSNEIEESDQCKEDAKSQKTQPPHQCTWDIVCSYKSGKCLPCQKCQSRCDPWCHGKLGKSECGDKNKQNCTKEAVCKMGDKVKCSACDFCNEAGKSSKPSTDGTDGCENFCHDKITKAGAGEKECNQNQK